MTANWAEDAACREVGWTLFTPADEHGTQARAAADYRIARKVCAICPVIEECLEYAMQAEGSIRTDDRAGMWGGRTPRERFQLYLERTGENAAA